MFKYISENKNDRGCLSVVFCFYRLILRYGAHCYLQVRLGLSFSLSWNTRSLARPWRSSEPRWAAVKWVGGFAVEQEASVGAKRNKSPDIRGARLWQKGSRSN